MAFSYVADYCDIGADVAPTFKARPNLTLFKEEKIKCHRIPILLSALKEGR
jgi:hypothetical protein